MASNNSSACAHMEGCIDTRAYTHRRPTTLVVRKHILRQGNKTFRVRGYNCRGRARARGLYEAGAARDGKGWRGVCSLGLGAPGGYRAPFFIL